MASDGWVQLATAAFTLANTVVLLFINRRSIDTHRRVNGLLIQQTDEAEARGRRLERRDAGQFGESKSHRRRRERH